MVVKYPDITAHLSGEDGNAFGIIWRVRQAMKDARVRRIEIDEFVSEAMDGDYDHLLQTCMKWVNVE